MFTRHQLAYLGQIILTLILLAAVFSFAALLPQMAISPALRWIALGAIGAALIALLPWASQRLKRCDELRVQINAQACVAALAILALTSALVGLLQMQDILPLFNQIWTFLAALAIWGCTLMYADRPFHVEDESCK